MKKRLILLLPFLILISYFLFNSLIGTGSTYFIHSFLSYEQKQNIKKYIFPYKTIAQQQVLIESYDPLKKQLSFKESNEEIYYQSDIKLSNNKILKRYQITKGFNHKINYKTLTGSGYIDFHNDNLIVLSPLGIIGYTENIETNNFFVQIKNNINDFIGIDQFRKNTKFTVKDLFINKDSLFISYTEEVKEDCWNTGVIVGQMDYKNITFKKLFSSDQCVHTVYKVDTMFSGNQSGGRIDSFDDDHILLSVGEFRERWLAQEPESINGKVLKININSASYEIISMGHRNPQGLYFDKQNNFILETEHGPNGGDEINLIEVDKIGENKLIQNFGWANASYGEHYCYEENYKGPEDCDVIGKKYPLHKSHTEHGYIEPLHSFSPSIGISQIVKVGENKYVVGAMGIKKKGGKSLYFFEIDNGKELVNLNKIDVYDRVRDIKFHKGNLYLFMGDSASIGVISLN
tara:strand:+ start:1318 stop:2700 length:1383 start_codon:yes stop_codon:yes gene_type:complete